jgi:hypothetical protein
MKKWFVVCVLVALAAGVFAIQRAQPASVQMTGNGGSPVEVSADGALADELLAVETQFWESWKNGKPEVFKELMANDAVFFGQFGVAPKDAILQQQAESVQVCKVESYALTSPRAIRIDENAAIFLYEAEQHAICGGGKVQPVMHGSSVYVKRGGKWINLYRSEVPPAQ